MHVLTGDYPAAAASHQQALALARRASDRLGEAAALNHLGLVQQLTGDYPAAAASQRQALALFREPRRPARPGSRPQRSWQSCSRRPGTTRPPPPASSRPWRCSQTSAHRLGQAYALNDLGELATRTAATQQARDHHGQALAIARDTGIPFEEARALEGIGHSYLHDGNPSQAAPPLRQALAIYQRTDAPAPGAFSKLSTTTSFWGLFHLRCFRSGG